MEKEIKTENRLTIMEQKIDNLIETVDKIDNKLDKHIDLEAKNYEKLDNKYSGKWVEKTLLVVIGIALTAIVGAVFKLILK